MPRIFVIIVTYNGLKWIDKCLSSLLNSSHPLEIIVVDNCSSDNTPDWVTENHSGIKLIQLNDNIGFGQANNIGLNEAKKANADYVFLLNQDAWVENYTIENLIVAHQCNNNFGIISPIHLNGSGDNLDLLFHSYLVNELAQSRDTTTKLLLQDGLDHSFNINFVNAAAWLITRKTIEKVGGFDPLFPHWGEDNNFIDRLKSQNLQVGICAKARIYHDREEAYKDRSRFYYEYYYREKLRKLLTPGQGPDFSEIATEMCQDLLRALLRFNVSRAHQIVNASLKLFKNRKTISGRESIYKLPYCFLDNSKQ